MTAVTLLPSILLMMTAFTRIVIVLAILRQALGAGQAPPNQVLVGLALFLTLFVMAPVVDQINRDAVQPYMAGSMEAPAAMQKGIGPLKDFMLMQTRESDTSPPFVRISGGKGFDKPEERAAVDPGAVVRDQRAEVGIPDRFPHLHSVRDHRPRGRERAHVHGHDDALARAHIAALQDHAVRADRTAGRSSWALSPPASIADQPGIT